MVSQKAASVQKLTFSIQTHHDKIAQPGVAAQKRGKQLSLETRIDAVVTLAWMADGMNLPLAPLQKLPTPA